MVPIVGIGASAGGLEALKILFGRLSPTTGRAYVVIQHLKADRESLTPMILSTIASMKVSEAQGGERALPDHVYTIPANTQMTIVDGILRIAPRTESPGEHHPFDRFLRSLASDCKEHATAVVLSGYDGDGSQGCIAIKANGGATFAQDLSAQVDQMPEHAIATGCVDHVLDPGQIADWLSQPWRPT